MLHSETSQDEETQRNYLQSPDLEPLTSLIWRLSCCSHAVTEERKGRMASTLFSVKSQGSPTDSTSTQPTPAQTPTQSSKLALDALQCFPPLYLPHSPFSRKAYYRISMSPVVFLCPPRSIAMSILLDFI